MNLKELTVWRIKKLNQMVASWSVQIWSKSTASNAQQATDYTVLRL